MNQRRTKQRQMILEAIETHGGHLTADEIYRIARKRHPRLSLGTVYRNLRVLTGMRLVRELDFGLPVTYFETIKDPHYHLICRECGLIKDLEIELNLDLVQLAQRASGKKGFEIQEHRLDFVGVCEKCGSRAVKTGPHLTSLKSR